LSFLAIHLAVHANRRRGGP